MSNVIVNKGLSMQFVVMARRILRGDPYAFGRFQIVRKLYGLIRGTTATLKQYFFPQKITQPLHTETLFPTINIDEAIHAIRTNSVTFGFNLPKTIVDELYHYANSTVCLRSGDRKAFRVSDVHNGKLSDNIPVVLGFVDNPQNCVALKKIISDPTLLAVITKHLGYTPKKIEPRLFWSFVNATVSDEYRIKNWQTVKYHFDVDGYNFIYANFYLTKVDAGSGAHIMIQGSHKKKPLKMLFHSAVQTDDAVLHYFGKHNEILIEGDAGFGFVQDSSCYHKALAPIAADRLMLQLRFK